MKILYVAGDRYGANEQLVRFLASSKHHKVVVAAYSKSSFGITYVDWLLDPLSYDKSRSYKLMDLLGFQKPIVVNVDSFKLIISEVGDFSPDLIIGDCDKYAGYFAKALDVPLWYCSPLLIFAGLDRYKVNINYLHAQHCVRKLFDSLHPAQKYLMYSPFGDLEKSFRIRKGYEWVSPYYNIVDSTAQEGEYKTFAILNSESRLSLLDKILGAIDHENSILSNFVYTSSSKYIKADQYRDTLANSNCVFCLGETNYVADAMINNKKLVVAPALNDYEALINASLLHTYRLGVNLGQVEYMDKYAVEYINSSLSSKHHMRKIEKRHNTLIEEIDAAYSS